MGIVYCILIWITGFAFNDYVYEFETDSALMVFGAVIGALCYFAQSIEVKL